MKKLVLIGCAIALSATTAAAQTKILQPPNPNINYSQFLQDAQRAEKVRQERRLSEAEFLQAMQEPKVILLDARNSDRYAQRHIRGAINLDFTEFTAESLSRIIPNKETKILIYCNNNFVGSPQSFAMKVAPASLNISTYVALTSYGYTNIYELAPTLNTKTSKLPFAGTEVSTLPTVHH